MFVHVVHLVDVLVIEMSLEIFYLFIEDIRHIKQEILVWLKHDFSILSMLPRSLQLNLVMLTENLRFYVEISHTSYYERIDLICTYLLYFLHISGKKCFTKVGLINAHCKIVEIWNCFHWIFRISIFACINPSI